MVRFKSRYVTFNIDSLESQNEKELIETLFEHIASLFGEYGRAVVDQSFRICYFNNKTNIVILKVNRGLEQHIIRALHSIEENNSKRRFDVFYVGATLIHCFESIVRYTSNLKVEKYQQIRLLNSKKRKIY